MKVLWLRIAYITFLIVLLSGCGIGAYVQPHPGVVDVTINASSMTLSISEFLATQITFNVRNATMEEIHNFILINTRLDPDKLPIDSAGRVLESQLNIVGSIQSLQPGQVSQLTVDLAIGHYDMISNVGSAYQHGVRKGKSVYGAD